MHLICFILLFLASPAAAQQWSPPVRISEPGGCLYPQILAFGDTLHVVYENASGYDKISYVRSTDAGQTWTEHVVLSPRAIATISPRIVGKGQRIMALWVHIFQSSVYRYNIGYAKSTDGGETWGGAQFVFSPNLPGILNLAAAGTDTLINVTYTADMYYYVKTSDLGISWSSPTEIISPQQFSKPDCASFGSVVHFAWDGRFDQDHRLETYYTRSSDGGLTWTPNVALSDTDQHHAQLPAIGMDETGNPAVTWMDYKYSPYLLTGDIFIRVSRNGGGTWGPEVQITERHRSTKSDITVAGESLFVVWQDDRPENGGLSIYFSGSTDNGQSWSPEYRLDADASESHFPAIATSNGRIYAAWTESSGVYLTRYPAEPDRVGEEPKSDLPEEISLRAYPNPFNSSTTITISGAEEAEIGIYDITGRRHDVLQVRDGRAVWNAEERPSGAYFARVTGKKGGEALRLVLLK